MKQQPKWKERFGAQSYREVDKRGEKRKEERKNKLSLVSDVRVTSFGSGAWKSVINSNVRLELPDLHANRNVQT